MRPLIFAFVLLSLSPAEAKEKDYYGKLLIAASISIAHNNCPTLDVDQDLYKAWLKLSGITPKVIASPQTDKALAYVLQTYDRAGPKEFCKLMEKSFGPNGDTHPGMLKVQGGFNGSGQGEMVAPRSGIY